ncbi:MAG: DUF308 domain-containing protein [Bacilli bacterium]|nr:DUF308 domain-containing protein [Bacilli bacterium]
MKSLFSKYVWLRFILSISLLFAGTLIIIFAATNKGNILQDGLDIIAATILFLFGLFAIISSFFFESNSAITNGLLYGSACIALGIFLCTDKFHLLPYVVLLLSIFFVVIGSVELIKGLLMIAQKFKNVTYIILTFVFAALFITGGILAICNQGKATTALCIIGGILLVACGAYQMVVGIKVMSAKKGNRNNKPARRSAPKKESQKEVKEIDYTK